MKKVFSLVVIFFLTICLSLLGREVNEMMLSTLYSVSGIMFSIGMGLIITISFENIKNKLFIRELRKNIIFIRNKYVIIFSTVTLIYILTAFDILNQYQFGGLIELNLHLFFNCLSLIIIIYSMVYFFINFIEIQKVKDDIFDKLNS